MNVKLTIAYEGTHFYGWQNNLSERSVEWELKKALELILNHSIVLQAASRTDRGVHANAQVVNFFTYDSLNLEQLVTSLNTILDPDIRILSAQKGSDTFHPTLDVKSKQYRYIISTAKVRQPDKRRVSWHFPYITSLANMKEAAKLIVGSHNFSGFSNGYEFNKNPYCTIHAIKFEEFHQELHIVLLGDRFLYKMVRIIVGTLAYIGSGKLKAVVIDEIFSSLDRKKGGVTAPAEGLVLDRIFYDSFPVC